jgi:hypothetical protein
MYDRVSTRVRARLFVVFAASLSAAPVLSQLPVPIHVVNPTSVARALEPVSVGFPVAKVPTPIMDPATFELRNSSGQPVPCQFKVLSRWGADRSVATAPLKWVLASFRPASVPANSTVSFSVVAAPGSAGAGISVTTTASTISVTTRPGTTFDVPISAFGPFSKVTVNSQIVSQGAGSLQVLAPNGSAMAVSVTSPTVVEETGAIRTVLRQRGSIGGLTYTTRSTFHAGRDDVSVDFRLENQNAYGLFATSIADGQVYFDLLSMNQPIGGSTLNVTSTLATHTIPSTGSFEVAQDFGTPVPYDALGGFTAVAKVNGSQVGSTGTYPGSVDVTGPAGGVTITVERFWQNFPKALRVQGGQTRIALFPEFGNGPEYKSQFGTPNSSEAVDPMALTNYRFEGGRWKTHRVVYSFHGPGALSPAAVAAEAERVNKPLVGYPEPVTVRKSFATGQLFIERSTPIPYPSFLRYNQFYDMMVDDNAATWLSSLGHIGLPAFINRGGTWGDRQPFGWENFGDLPWADGYSNLHYNWPANLLLEFLRTGDWRFFDRGRDMAVFRRDYGQNHSTNASEVWRGAGFYEKGWWHGNSYEGEHGHNWPLGVLLHYVLTGDEGSREAALEGAAFSMRHPPGQWTGWWGSRIPGRAIENLVDAYNFLGDPQWLAAAGAGVARFEQLEVADGMNGYHLNPANGTTTVWMDNVFYVAACKYVLASNDFSNLAFLGRMRNWFKNECLIWPQGPVTASTMPVVYEVWAPLPTTVRTRSVHHDWEMMEALSYSAVIHADLNDYYAATLLFEGVTRYWQVGASTTAVYNANNGAAWSPITFRPSQYPSTESKVLGIVLNGGNPHMAIRSFVDGNW